MRTLTNPTKVAAAAIATGLLLAACGSGGASTESLASGPRSDSAPEDDGQRCTAERVGGTITMGEYSMLPSFSPGQGAFGARGGAESAAVFDRLMRWDPHASVYSPKMAESLTANEDNTVWTLTLRPSVTFSNGDPVTAEAVKFTIGLHQDPQIRSSVFSDVQHIRSAEVVDPETVKFTLDSPWATFPSVLASAAGEVINPAVYQTMPPDQFALDPAGAGAGAYLVKRNAPGEELVLEPNPNYYGGPVCATLRFIAIPGQQATSDAFRTGEIQSAFFRDPAVVSALQESGARGFTELTNAGKILNINTGKGGYSGITTDVRIRHAIAAALNPDLINDRLSAGKGEPTSALLSEKSVLFSGAPGTDYDIETAKRLVAEVKSEKGWDGRVSLLAASTADGTEQAVLIKAMLDSAGFDVTIDSVPVAQVTAASLKGEYEISSGGLPLRDENPASGLASTLGTGGATNMSGVSIPSLDAAISDLRAAETLDEKKTLMEKVQTIVNAEQPIAVYGALEDFIAISPNVKGVVQTSGSTVLFDGAFLDAR